MKSVMTIYIQSNPKDDLSEVWISSALYTGTDVSIAEQQLISASEISTHSRIPIHGILVRYHEFHDIYNINEDIFLLQEDSKCKRHPVIENSQN